MLGKAELGPGGVILTMLRFNYFCLLTLLASASSIGVLSAQTVGQPPVEACRPGAFTVIGYPNEFSGNPDTFYDVFVDSKFDGGFLTTEKIWLPAIQSAIDTWNSVTGATLEFSAPQLTDNPASPLDGRLTISPCGFTFACPESVPTIPGDDPPDIIRIPGLERAQGSTLAVALVTTDRSVGRPIRDADIFFNSGIPFQTSPTAGQIDFENVVLHELGHALGLGHNDNCSVGPTVMESIVDLGPRPRSLGGPEVEGARFLYPEPGAARIRAFQADRDLHFAATVGEDALLEREINIYGIEGDRWIANISTTDGADWVSVNPTVGRFAKETRVSLAIETGGLPAGTHTATISFDIDGVDDQPLAIPVQVTVESDAVIDPPTINDGGAVNSANMLSESLAPGSLVTIFGSNLASDTAGAVELPLPSALADTSVVISGIRAPLLFVNDQQINAQVPYQSLEGRSQIVVRTARGESIPARISIAEAAPEFFTAGDNQVIAVNSDGQLNASGQPAQRESTISLYLTGLGATSPAVETGVAAPFVPLARASGKVSVSIGGAEAEVLFAGLAPGFVGLGQIDLVVPDGLTGRLPIRAIVSGTASTVAFVHVQ